MKQFPLNPFRYGKPVPPQAFVGRAEALRTVFGRLHNGESTAVVGEPHIGKSSFLRYLRDQQMRAAWMGDISSQALVAIDCHLLPMSFRPADFWQEVVDQVGEAFGADALLARQIEVVRQSGYGSFTLKRLFDLLGRSDRRAVLLVDEFDVLLGHPNFNTAEFFGALRSLAINTDGLALVTFSRLPVAEMNRRSHAINPLGSPFFNNLIEVRLLPLKRPELDELIDRSLEGTGVQFGADERAFVERASGRHPFLAQLVCAALFDAGVPLHSTDTHRQAVEQLIQGWAAQHFADVWRHLSAEYQRALLLLAQAEFPHPDAIDLGQPERYAVELRWLAEGGLITPAEEQAGAPWRGEWWRVASASFARWLVSTRAWQTPEPSDIVADREAERAALERQLEARRRRLWALQETQARKGNDTPADVINEIEDLVRAVAADERRLQALNS